MDISPQGKLYIRGDSKIFRFQKGKSESLFLQRKNPRRIAWTVLFRRQHRKGITEVWTHHRCTTDRPSVCPSCRHMISYLGNAGRHRAGPARRFEEAM